MSVTMEANKVRLSVEVTEAFRRTLRSLTLEIAPLTMGDIIEAIMSGDECPVTLQEVIAAVRRRRGEGESEEPKGRKGGAK